TAEHLGKDGKSSVVDVGSFKPEEVEKFQAKVEERKSALVREKADLERQRADLDTKTATNELERKKLDLQKRRLDNQIAEAQKKAEGLDRIQVHNPFSTEVRDLA